MAKRCHVASPAAGAVAAPTASGKRSGPPESSVDATPMAKRCHAASPAAFSPSAATVQDTPLRTPRAAEALAASARKSEAATPMVVEDAGDRNGLTDVAPASSDPKHLLQRNTVTLRVKSLFRGSSESG